MHSALGGFLVMVALAASVFGAVVALAAGFKKSSRGLQWAQGAAYVFGGSLVVANVTMIRALLAHDFSVSYVAKVGSLSTPTWVTVVSLWSSLEGSILFWGGIIGVYVIGFTFAMRNRHRLDVPFALGMVLLVASFFAFLLATVANPFIPMSPVPLDGPGPNPLLQNHVLMAIHPPLLYLGFAGLLVPFGLALSSLLRGQFNAGWLKVIRFWTFIPWIFLSLGIIVGGWWAYEVLGWGGYWAWDPVENASFLPWLAATAFLHSSIVQQRRNLLKVWSLTLLICSFLLVILGTFMTRSGVFNSVHSFTQSNIGPAFLAFLGLLTLISLGLLSGRAHLFKGDGRILSMFSREAMFLLNNVVFTVFTFFVLLGTTYPLINEALTGTKISVGEPYFNKMAVPIGAVLVLLMGLATATPWGRPNLRQVLRGMIGPAVIALLVLVISIATGLHGTWALITFTLCSFTAAITVREMLLPAWNRARVRDESMLATLPKVFAGNRRRIGGLLVHLSILAMIAAIAASQTYRTSVEVSVIPNESFEIGPYKLTFKELVGVERPHRYTVQARLAVTKGDRVLDDVNPALNFYATQREPVGAPDVNTVGFTDLYASLLSYEEDGSRAGVKVYLMPLVPWLWWGMVVLVAGSVICLWPRRRVAQKAPDGATAGAS